MENKPPFVLGLLVLIFAGVSIFIPTYIGGATLHVLFLTIGILLNINAGILLLLGGIWNSRNIEGTGFGIGAGAWGLIVASSIWGIVYWIGQINVDNINNMLMLYLSAI